MVANLLLQNTKENKESHNHFNNIPKEDFTETGIRSVPNSVKPVNLLPQVPINNANFRKLSENEEHDCEIIGMWEVTPKLEMKSNYVFRTFDQIVFFNREEIDTGYRPQSYNALHSKLR